ncbi:glycosyltransferase [Pedobacter sp. BS3]|uniref:glycosyltransferase n=1 Tax=Pedobacter sp. BS3 TaxID=2567937 RepID=UPI00293937FE|nr:glycosyltransferase [Pedobacter sp. BS3]
MKLIVTYLWIGIQIIIAFNLVFPLLLLLFHAFKTWKKQVRKPLISTQPDYAVIVTAYEETANLPAVVSSILHSTYPDFILYVVADKCDISGLHFDDPRVVLLRPEDTLSGNTRSHFYAIAHFKRPHSHLTIIDSDNLVAPTYLQELTAYFNQGYQAVQGIRKAKNLDSTYACLDAARDIYYHFYDGKLLFEAGSSATLAGSGMAFTTALYKNCLEKLDVQGAGFDKVLQAQILNRDLRIAFAEHAIVFDEKTSRSEQLVKQRSRWINTWFKYFSYGFTLIGKGIRHFSLNQLLFGVVLLRPPLFIFLLLSVLFMLTNLWISLISSVAWFLALACFVGSFYIALTYSDTDKRIYASLSGIPKFMLYQVISLFKVRRANQHSVATRHYHHTELESRE